MTTTNKGRFGVREVSNTDIKLSFGQKLAYGIGDCGYNLMYYWVSTYLMIFYTDTIGISAAAVAVLMLVIRIFDAVNDPIIGSMADTTKQKTGTYCRWIQWGSFALGVTAILLFTGNPNWSNTAKLIYAYVTYTLVVIASTCTNMPYGVLNGTLTSNGLERTKISTIRMFCITLGNMGVTALAVPVLNAFGMSTGHNSRAYLLTLIVFCLVAVPMLWTTAFGCKEVIMLPKQQKVAMKDRLQTLKAWPIWSLILGMTLFGMIYYGRAAVYPYYFTYYCGNAGMLTFFGVMMGIGGLIGSTISTKMHQIFKNKGTAALVNMLVNGAAILCIFWVSPMKSMVGFYALTLINGICMGVHLCLQYAMIPDAIDYSEMKTGVAAPGFLYTLTSFGMKVGNAVGTAIVAAVFGALGYVANAVQNAAVMSAINLSFTIVSAVVCVLTGLLFGAWGISDKKYAEIQAELERRRNAA